MANAKLPRSDFYVYVLFRHDTGQPFYVGKGCGRRWERHDNQPQCRNRHKNFIIASAKRAGTSIPAVKVAVGLIEAAAFEVERSLIAAIGRRADGGPLANLTEGGEGASGTIISEATRLKHRLTMHPSFSMKGRRHTDEAKAKSSKAHKGLKRTPEQCANISAAQRGKQVSGVTRAKLSAAHKGQSASEETRAKLSAMRMGHGVSEETREKLRIAITGKTHSPEARAKMRAARLGTKHSEGTRAKMSAAHTVRNRRDVDKDNQGQGS